MPDNLDQIVESSQAERLATGFEFTEGPVWHPDGHLLFVDIRRSLSHRLAPGGQPELFREHSGGSNGLTFDLQGRLIMCEGAGRRAARMDPDVALPTHAQRSARTRLNRLHDCTLRAAACLHVAGLVDAEPIL